ncbi:hypothetical protein Syun_026216 [Stephania yunnanensis]|uniref:Uncharacterized protein n=1 Tax=Stephania yunnanensis TaxID=152371 RepID=A0AAP0ET32_9MAGN
MTDRGAGARAQRSRTRLGDPRLGRRLALGFSIDMGYNVEYDGDSTSRWVKHCVKSRDNTVVANGQEGAQAVALKLSRNNAFLYNTSILGSQDTLLDLEGKHYFYKLHRKAC